MKAEKWSTRKEKKCIILWFMSIKIVWINHYSCDWPVFWCIFWRIECAYARTLYTHRLYVGWMLNNSLNRNIFIYILFAVRTSSNLMACISNFRSMLIVADICFEEKKKENNRKKSTWANKCMQETKKRDDKKMATYNRNQEKADYKKVSS